MLFVVTVVLMPTGLFGRVLMPQLPKRLRESSKRPRRRRPPAGGSRLHRAADQNRSSHSHYRTYGSCTKITATYLGAQTAIFSIRVSPRRAATQRSLLRLCRNLGSFSGVPWDAVGPFREHADLPTDLAGDGPNHRPRKTLAKAKEQVPRTTDDKAARKAALAFAREQRRRENQRRKEEAARERQRQQRNQAIARAQAALEMSEREHPRRQSRPRGTLSKRNRKQRMPVGRRRRTGLRGLCADPALRAKVGCGLLARSRWLPSAQDDSRSFAS